MLKTYTLYLRHQDGAQLGFEPALCNSDSEAMARARELLAQRPDADAVDVNFGEDHLYRVAGAAHRQA